MCTQYGICGQAADKNARAMFFSKIGRGRQQFLVGFRKPQMFSGGLPPPLSASPRSSKGDV